MAHLHRSVSAALRGFGVRRTDRVLVALSGGADSVALLRLLLAVDQRVAVGHVHHGLRADADADQAFVTELARLLGVASGTRRVDATAADGRSPEARARALRYVALEELRGVLDCAHIATAHTLDDQAETVLLRGIRGTGPDGLAAIAPMSRDRRILRPLLRVRRADLRGHLRALGHAWREDASNDNAAVPRNRLRRDVLPVLEEIHPGASEKLAALAELAHEERVAGLDAAHALLDRSVAAASDGLHIEAAPFCAADPVLRRRALRALLERAGLGEHVTRTHVERVERFLEGAARGAALSLPQSCELVRRDRHFWLGRSTRSAGEHGAASERRSRQGRQPRP